MLRWALAVALFLAFGGPATAAAHLYSFVYAGEGGWLLMRPDTVRHGEDGWTTVEVTTVHAQADKPLLGRKELTLDCEKQKWRESGSLGWVTYPLEGLRRELFEKPLRALDHPWAYAEADTPEGALMASLCFGRLDLAQVRADPAEVFDAFRAMHVGPAGDDLSASKRTSWLAAERKAGAAVQLPPLDYERRTLWMTSGSDWSLTTLDYKTLDQSDPLMPQATALEVYRVYGEGPVIVVREHRHYDCRRRAIRVSRRALGVQGPAGGFRGAEEPMQAVPGAWIEIERGDNRKIELDYVCAPLKPDVARFIVNGGTTEELVAIYRESRMGETSPPRLTKALEPWREVLDNMRPVDRGWDPLDLVVGVSLSAAVVIGVVGAVAWAAYGLGRDRSIRSIEGAFGDGQG